MSETGDTGRQPLVGREALAYVVSIQSFTRWLGVEVDRAEYGEVDLSLAFRPQDMGQHHGFAHGGLIGSLVDIVCAFTAATVVGDVLTAQYSVNFLRPGIGERIVARGRLVSSSRRQVVVRADIFGVGDSGEKLIAVGDGVIMPAGERNSITGEGKDQLS